MSKEYIRVIGAGLAGCAAALKLSELNVKVRLYEAKPKVKSPAHSMDGFCELVCSNSLKGNGLATAGGLLKEELRLMKSAVIAAADEARVPAGGALAVDRNLFSEKITSVIKNDKNIDIIPGVVPDIDNECFTIIATGPLTIEPFSSNLKKALSMNLYFYDAASPIIDALSIDMSRAFKADRYNKGGGSGDYINCPLTKEEYLRFQTALTEAEAVKLKEFEELKVFEGCMPVEEMAKRGIDALRFGPLKPVGFTDPKTGKRPYALVQLRKENLNGTLYNLVGFQTNLKFNEQKRVFSMIPALENAEFLRYGVMHRNTYIDAPKTIDSSLRCKNLSKIYIAGQLCGVEGYVESIMTGTFAALNAARALKGLPPAVFGPETMSGALLKYLETENADFQPMNANFGILPPLPRIIKDKAERKLEYSRRALESLKKSVEEYFFF